MLRLTASNNKKGGSKRQSGFTLIELIVTMLIMGILAYGSVQFILNTSGAYASSQERSRLGLLATSTIERLSKEIKQAEPDSLRTNDNEQSQCIEFMSTLSSVQQNQGGENRLENQLEIVTPSPVSICWVDENLYRYSNYSTTKGQPTPKQLPSTTGTGRVLIADQVSAPERMFQLVKNGLGQSQWLLLTIDFLGQDTHLMIQQEVGLSMAAPLSPQAAVLYE